MQTQPIAFKPPGSYSSAAVPKHVVQQRFRTPKKNIPQTTVERNHFLHVIRNYVAEFNPVPPMPADELKIHADRGIGMGFSFRHLNHDQVSAVAAHVDGIGFGTNGAVVSSGSKQYTIGQVLSVHATN